jgi:hypothetical protein
MPIAAEAECPYDERCINTKTDRFLVRVRSGSYRARIEIGFLLSNALTIGGELRLDPTQKNNKRTGNRLEYGRPGRHRG